MGVEFSWDDDDKTVIRYTATESWNWTDFHRTVRVSLFALHNLNHQIDTIFDLSQSPKTAGGAVAHIRSVGKKQHPSISGRAIVIGLEHDIVQKLTIGGANQVILGDQTLYFVDDEAAAQAILREFQGG